MAWYPRRSCSVSFITKIHISRESGVTVVDNGTEVKMSNSELQHKESKQTNNNNSSNNNKNNNVKPQQQQQQERRKNKKIDKVQCDGRL